MTVLDPTQPAHQPEPPQSPGDARARAKADKAYRKAMRPWFKKKRFILPLVLLLLIVIAGLGGGGEEAADTAEAPAGAAATEAPAGEPAAEPAPAPEEPAIAGIGAPVRDGKFEFTVGGVNCGQTTIGESEYLQAEAQGQFCIVDVTVANIGDEPQSFFGDNAKLFNDQGQEFSADTEAAIYMDESNSLYEEINPGNSLQGQVVFDVPEGMVVDRVELHDSAFSEGVAVALR